MCIRVTFGCIILSLRTHCSRLNSSLRCALCNLNARILTIRMFSFQCVPISGLGFRRGSYRCVCKNGFYFPNVTSSHKHYNGTVLEEEYEKKYDTVSFFLVFSSPHITQSPCTLHSTLPTSVHIYADFIGVHYCVHNKLSDFTTAEQVHAPLIIESVFFSFLLVPLAF